MPRELKPCGTTAAYVRHKKAGEKPCELCRLHVNAQARIKHAEKQAKKREGRVVDRLIHQIIETRWGHWDWKTEYDREWNVVQRVWTHYRPFRYNPYPFYKWEKAEVRQHIVPMQSVLHELFPYNAEHEAAHE